MYWNDPKTCTISELSILYVTLEPFVLFSWICTVHSLLSSLTRSFSLLFCIPLWTLSVLFTSLWMLSRTGLPLVLAVFKVLVNTNFCIILSWQRSNSAFRIFVSLGWFWIGLWSWPAFLKLNKHVYTMVKSWGARVSLTAWSWRLEVAKLC